MEIASNVIEYFKKQFQLELKNSSNLESLKLDKKTIKVSFSGTCEGKIFSGELTYIINVIIPEISKDEIESEYEQVRIYNDFSYDWDVEFDNDFLPSCDLYDQITIAVILEVYTKESDIVANLSLEGIHVIPSFYYILNRSITTHKDSPFDFYSTLTMESGQTLSCNLASPSVITSVTYPQRIAELECKQGKVTSSFSLFNQKRVIHGKAYLTICKDDIFEYDHYSVIRAIGSNLYISKLSNLNVNFDIELEHSGFCLNAEDLTLAQNKLADIVSSAFGVGHYIYQGNRYLTDSCYEYTDPKKTSIRNIGKYYVKNLELSGFSCNRILSSCISNQGADHLLACDNWNLEDKLLNLFESNRSLIKYISKEAYESKIDSHIEVESSTILIKSFNLIKDACHISFSSMCDVTLISNRKKYKESIEIDFVLNFNVGDIYTLKCDIIPIYHSKTDKIKVNSLDIKSVILKAAKEVIFDCTFPLSVRNDFRNMYTELFFLQFEKEFNCNASEVILGDSLFLTESISIMIDACKIKLYGEALNQEGMDYKVKCNFVNFMSLHDDQEDNLEYIPFEINYRIVDCHKIINIQSVCYDYEGIEECSFFGSDEELVDLCRHIIKSAICADLIEKLGFDYFAKNDQEIYESIMSSLKNLRLSN